MRNRQPTGMTLIELLISLLVVAICATAVESMLAAAINTDRYLRTSTTAVSEIESAIRRITHNVRTCATLTSPTGTTAQTTLTLTTQPDPTNNNAAYAVSYTLVGTQLEETDSRYGTNVIAHNVSAFTVTIVTTPTPTIVQVSLTIGTQPAFTRNFRVYCRNL